MFSVSSSGEKAWIFHQGDVLNWPRTEETYSLMPESPKLMFFYSCNCTVYPHKKTLTSNKNLSKFTKNDLE